MNARRFWSKVEKSESCWLWTGAKNRGGYGVFKVDGRVVPSHRVACQLEVGPIPPGKCVCHKCDVRLCVRPSHLYIGTQSDNMRDRFDHGNGPFGVLKPHIAEILSLYSTGLWSYKKLAFKFGVSHTAIWKTVKTRKEQALTL